MLQIIYYVPHPTPPRVVSIVRFVLSFFASHCRGRARYLTDCNRNRTTFYPSVRSADVSAGKDPQLCGSRIMSPTRTRPLATSERGSKDDRSITSKMTTSRTSCCRWLPQQAIQTRSRRRACGNLANLHIANSTLSVETSAWTLPGAWKTRDAVINKLMTTTAEGIVEPVPERCYLPRESS